MTVAQANSDSLLAQANSHSLLAQTNSHSLLAQANNPIIRWSYLVDEWDQIQAALIQHIEITLLSVGLGLVISAVLSVFALRYRWAIPPITGLTGFIFTIPSVALFGLLVPYFGYNRITAVIPLGLYSLLVLFTNTIAGFDAVPRAVVDAADGMGLTATQKFLRVELPLAMPLIITGLRIAMVTTVGMVTVAAIIGQGGLGSLILDGLRRAFWTPMTVGSVFSIGLALAFDGLIYLVGRMATPWARHRSRA